MDEPGTVSTEEASGTTPAGSAVAVDDTLVEDVLVEEVSIDGMCGVY